MPVIKSTRWCFTVNNPSMSYDALDHVDCKYMICAQETAPTTGTIHFQGYIVFEKQKTLTGVKNIFLNAHWEVAKGTTEQNVTYCSKDGLYHEYGTKPKSVKELAKDSKERWADVIRSAKEGTCQDEYPAEYIRFNGTILKMRESVYEDNENLCGVWYYGPSGSGKSRAARATYPGLYDKLLNKWWDNYEGQDAVLLDDLDHFGAPSMGHALKRYADHYPFRVEIKGSSMVIRPKVIIVTSQYSIEELWPMDAPLQEALRRRFRVVAFKVLQKTMK